MNMLKRWAAVVAAVTLAFVAGCGGEKDESADSEAKTDSVGKQAVSESLVVTGKIAALEKEVARLRAELHQLRHRVEEEAKMRSRQDQLPPSHRPGSRVPEDLRHDEFRARHSARRNDPAMMRGGRPAEWQDPASMTPEQRRSWHEERRRMRDEMHRKMLEERQRAKISESGKQTTNTKKENQ